MPMQTIRACRPFLAARSFRCRPPSGPLLLHLESRKILSRLPSRCSVDLPSYRNFSTSSTRRVQYSRFDDDPNRPSQFPESSRLKTRDIVIYTVATGAIVYYFVHLEQVPETGRWRFMDVSPKLEDTLWNLSYEGLSTTYSGKLLPPTHVLTRHVHRVVSRILEANNLGTLRDDLQTPIPTRSMNQTDFGFGSNDIDQGSPDLWDPDVTGRSGASGTARKEWSLLVVNDEKVVNAMAAPGTIVVFTGILPVAQDEQGLAAILGHEIGHVVARHTAERYSYLKILIAISWLVEAIGLPSGVGGVITTLLMELPHSRKQEHEADKIGLTLSAKACFDPKASPEMFKRLGALQKSATGLNLSFLNTHPGTDERIRQLQSLLPDAFAIQASACRGTADYLGAFDEAAKLERGSS